MQTLQAPKSKSVLSKARKGARNRYWAINPVPTQTKQKQLGIVRRFNRDDRSTLQRVHDLGNASDVAVLQISPGDLKQSLAFAEHQARFQGALQRLKRCNPWSPVPRRVEAIALKAAFMCKSKEEK